MKFLFIFLFAFLTASFLYSQQKISSQNSMQFSSDQRSLINIGGWSYWQRYDGQSAHDPSGSPGGVYPHGTASAIYQDGFIWGGFVIGDPDSTKKPLRVGGQTYNIGTVPGWINPDGQPADPDHPRLRVYRIRADWRELEDNKEVLRRDAAELYQKEQNRVSRDDLEKLWLQYKKDWEEWPADLGAPFIDKDADGRYNPDVDMAGLAGADQVIWYVVNDLDEAAVANLYGSDPIGLELQVTVWGYQESSGPLGQAVFKRYRIINKSSYRVDSMFVGQWSDPDVGTYTDDLVGCDSTLGLGFAYNGFARDGQYDTYGLAPASVGYLLLQGPMVKAQAGRDVDNNGLDDASASQPPAIINLKPRPGFVNLPMTSFQFNGAGSPYADPPIGDYSGTRAWYNVLNGFRSAVDPLPYTVGAGPKAGDTTKFPLHSDPYERKGDLDGSGANLYPADRRMTLCSGPFNFAPGDTQEVVVAIVGGFIENGYGDNRKSFLQMKLNMAHARQVYNTLFKDLPVAPHAPVVTAVPFEDKIVLEWGNPDDYREAESSAFFEGYNIYQLPNPWSGPEDAKLLTTFDRKNGVTFIKGIVFNREFNNFVETPLFLGEDTGIKRSIEIDRDAIKNSRIYAGQPYYFAVTGYNYYPELARFNPVSESPFNIFEVTAQGTRPGNRFEETHGDTIPVSRNELSTGDIRVTVIDPRKLQNREYEVTFSEEPQYEVEPLLDDDGNISGYDTSATAWYKWNLSADGALLLEDQANLSGDLDYPFVDGLMVQVMGPKKGGYKGWDYRGNRWVSGVDAGGIGFFGGLFHRYDFFGPPFHAEDMKPVQLVFQDQADVDANGYASEGAVYRRDKGYAYEGIGKLPFAAFDLTDPENPRRLNITFIENDFGDGSATANLLWDMGWDGSRFYDLGAREYIFIHDSDYNGGVDYDDVNWAPAADVLWAIWPQARGSRSYLLAEFTLDIYVDIPLKPGDSFSFSPAGFIENNRDLARADVEKINVFPNPFYAHNPSTADASQRFVTFNHLPRKATIRIFDLSGWLVQKFEKDDDSQFFRWNLLNRANIHVGSGLYIVHIDMPELGKKKVLKMMLVMPNQ